MSVFSQVPSPVPSTAELNSNFLDYHQKIDTLETRDHTLGFKKCLLHKWTYNQSILCLACSPKRNLLFCGTQDSTIIVFDLVTFQKRLEINAHAGSVLCLYMSECENILFSGGSDSLVKIWEITEYEKDLEIKPTHTIYSLVDIGDIFSLSWISEIKTVFIGAQNASISYIHIDTKSESADLSFMPSNRFDKFFDSKGSQRQETPDSDISVANVKLIEIPSSNIISYAHNGYVYVLDTINNIDARTSTLGGNIAEQFKHVIVSGGGDGEIRLWGYKEGRLTLFRSLDNEETVLSCTINKKNSCLYCGLVDGIVKVWDLSTFQLLRTFEIDKNDVYTVAIRDDLLFMGTEEGITKRFLAGEETSNIKVTKNEPCLTLKAFIMNDSSYLVSAGTDRSISLWSIDSLDNTCQISEPSKTSLSEISQLQPPLPNPKVSLANDKMLQVLSKLISFRTVSQKPDLYQNECRQCANFLTLLIKNMGASKSELLPVPNGNPIVHAVFTANYHGVENEKIPRILWYGHYDVIPASKSTWKTDPFALTPLNGYLYARGSTDNKGPLLAAIYAVAESYSKKELKSDVVFIIEGEEEAGSWGFQDAILKYRSIIGEIDWVLLSNSYWLDDHIPCLNYGLRGVIRIQADIWSDNPDRHSGVDGGIGREPTVDLIHLLGKLNDMKGKVIVPGFERINGNSLAKWEVGLYDEISKRVHGVRIEDLLQKWREPSLSVHRVSMSGPDNGTVIPHKACAKLSVRIVPGQDLNLIKKDIVGYLEKCFADLETENHLKVQIVHEAEPWLGDVNNSAYRILYESLKEEWGVDPIYIREGGSIPSIRFLEKAFNCEAAHLPTGQASDNAHLNDERVSITNLFKTRQVLKKTFNRLPCKRRSE